MRSTRKIRLQKITVKKYNKYNKYNPKKGTRKWRGATGKALWNKNQILPKWFALDNAKTEDDKENIANKMWDVINNDPAKLEYFQKLYVNKRNLTSKRTSSAPEDIDKKQRIGTDVDADELESINRSILADVDFNLDADKDRDKLNKLMKEHYKLGDPPKKPLRSIRSIRSRRLRKKLRRRTVRKN